MSDESSSIISFIDTNVWLYILLPGQDDVKAHAARELVRTRPHKIIISIQVVNEVVNGVLRNGAMSEGEIRELIPSFLRPLRRVFDYRIYPTQCATTPRKIFAFSLGQLDCVGCTPVKCNNLVFGRYAGWYRD